MDFVNQAVFKASVTAFVSPDLATNQHLQDIIAFDDHLPPVFLGIPMAWIKSGRNARESLFQTVSKIQTQHLSPVLQSQTKLMQSLGLSLEDIQRTTLFLLWASVGNSMPAVFWVLFFLLKHPDALQAVQTELQQFPHDHDQPWTTQEIDQMVVLQSVFTETLRMASSLRVLRDVLQDFDLNLKQPNQPNYRVQKGSVVVSFLPLLHFNPDIFDNPHSFQWDRFLPNKNTSSNLDSMMRAFGGGVHLCPGRKFIANEVKVFVATLISNCDMRLAPHDDCHYYDQIQASKWRQGAGIPQPNLPVDIQLKFKPKKL